VQGPVIAKYGFEPSRRGVWQVVQAFRGSLNIDPEIGAINVTNDWLTDPDLQAQDPRCQYQMTSWKLQCHSAAGWKPSPMATDYGVHISQPDDLAVINGIERCQGALAGAHHALYGPAHPQLHQEDWFHALGCRGVQDAIESGVLFLHAMAVSTGEIVGYISSTSVYDESRPAGEGGGHAPGPHTKINHIAVLPHHRYRGIGRMLFQELLAHLAIASPSVARDLRLSVAAENGEALEWYRRLDFIEVGDVEMEFPDKSRARFLRMQRLGSS